MRNLTGPPPPPLERNPRFRTPVAHAVSLLQLLKYSFRFAYLEPKKSCFTALISTRSPGPSRFSQFSFPGGPAVPPLPWRTATDPDLEIPVEQPVMQPAPHNPTRDRTNCHEGSEATLPTPGSGVRPPQPGEAAAWDPPSDPRPLPQTGTARGRETDDIPSRAKVTRM